MGLDIVELVMAFEAGFGVEIPNDAASEMRTPRDVVTWLAQVLPRGDAPRCLSQRAFYRLRERCGQRLDVALPDAAPDTRLDDVLAGDDGGTWNAIGQDLGCERWPAPRPSGWWGRTFEGGRPTTLGDAARFAATWYPRAIKGADAGWTLAEIERSVIAIIEAQTGVDMGSHSLDSYFVDDLRLD